MGYIEFTLILRVSIWPAGMMTGSKAVSPPGETMFPAESVTWKLSQCRVQEARGGVPRGVCVFGDEEGAPSKPAAPKALAAAEPEPVGSSSLEVLSDDELEDVASMHASDPAHGDEAPVKGRKKVVKK
jgi:hypothetical protein